MHKTNGNDTSFCFMKYKVEKVEFIKDQFRFCKVEKCMNTIKTATSHCH